jgi:hypothetical protein
VEKLRFGKYWQVLASIGKIWQVLASIGKYWQVLARFGKIWQDLESWKVRKDLESLESSERFGKFGN